MKNRSFFYLLVLCWIQLLSCNSKTENTASDAIEKPVKLTFSERINRHITGSLSIPATEKFTTAIYKAHLNSDNSEDAIITVNRLEFAKNKAASLPNKKQIEAFGYMGNYNFFVFYDGKTDRFSVPVPVASSTLNPLKVKFEHVLSDTYMDLTVEYRILNSGYKNYYSIQGGTLQEVFMVNLFDHLGESTEEAYYIEYGKGSISSAKNILVYNGKIKNSADFKRDSIHFEPEIEKVNVLHKRWFYNPKIMKYMSEDPSLMK